MATRINTKFVLLLTIAVFTAAGIVGGLWVLQRRGDTSRHIKAGDAMMVEACILEAAGDDAGAGVIFEKAYNEYGRAVHKEPANLDHLRKVEAALLSLRPMTRDQANEFGVRRIAILLREVRYQPGDADVHLKLITELYRNVRWFGQFMPRSGLVESWQDLADAGEEMYESLMPGDVKRVYGRLYRGLAQMQLMGYGGIDIAVRTATQEEIDAAMADLTAFVQAVPDSDLGHATLIDAQLSLARQLRSEGSRAATAAFEELETLLAAALEAVPDGPETARVAALTLTLEYEAAGRKADDPELIAVVNRMVDLVAPSDNPMLLADAGLLLRATDRANGQARAIELLDTYVASNPDAHYQRFALARLYYLNRDWDSAREQCRVVINARPVKVGALARILQLLRVRCAALIVDCEYSAWERADEADKADQLAKAVDAREVLADLVTDPDTEPLLLKADGKLAAARGDHATAAARFERVRQLTTSREFDVLWYAARSLDKIDQIGLAHHRLVDAAQMQPFNPVVLAYKARIEYRLGLYTEAQATAEAVLKLEPDNIVATRIIAAIDTTRTGPADEASTPLARTLLAAQAANRDGDIDGARDILLNKLEEEAVDRLPILTELVSVELRDGRPDVAKQYLAEALVLEPGNAFLRKLQISLNTEDQIEALKQYMAELHPDEVDLVVNSLIHLDALAKELEKQVVRYEAAQDMEAADRARARAIVAHEESDVMLARALEIASAHPVLLEYLFNEALREQDWPELELLVARAKAADSDQAGGLIFSGRYELARENYEQAIRTLTEATERKHYSAVAWRFLGRAHERVGHFAEAVRAYEHSYTRNPNDRITIRWYVNLLLQTGERDRGLRVLRATKHTIPNDVLLREVRLQLEAEIGDAVVAIRERRRNYALRPKDRVNAMRLAGLLTMTSPTYEHVVDDQGNPRYKADAWQLLSEKERRDRLAESAAEWDRESKEILAAIEAEGKDGLEIAALRAELLMTRGLVDKGEQLLREYRDLHSDDVRVYLVLGAYQRKAERIEDAIVTLESARQYQSETRREADLALADLYFAQARWSDAGELYEEVVAVNPGRGIQLRLVECFTKLNRYGEADVALTQVVASGGKDFFTAMLRASIAEGLADALFEEGQAQRAELKDAEVLAALDEAERLEPSSHLPHVRRAQLLFKAFHRTGVIPLLDDALGALNHADRVRAGADATSRVRVEILRAKGDDRGAIGELTRLLKRRPDDMAARVLLVQLLAKSGNHAGAMQVVTAAIKRNPSIATWHDALGELYVQRSMTAPDELRSRKEAVLAAAEFRESHRLQPNATRLAKFTELTLAGNDPDFAAVTSLIEETRDAIEGRPLLRGLYAAALVGEGRNTEALEQMRLAWGEHAEILELQPNNHRGLVSWYQMLQVVLSDRDPAEYEKVIRELTDGEPTPLSLLWSARAWGVGRDRDDVMHAIALLDTAASRCPADDYALLGMIGLDRGLYQVGLGNYREATTSFEAVIALAAADPNVADHALALNNAAFLYAEYLDDPGKAAEFAQRAAAVNPDDPSILDTLGWAQCKLGRYEEAEDALRRSIAIRPSPDNHLHLAWVFYETDRRDRTRSYLLKAEALHPSPDTQARINELNRKLRR